MLEAAEAPGPGFRSLASGIQAGGLPRGPRVADVVAPLSCLSGVKVAGAVWSGAAAMRCPGSRALTGQSWASLGFQMLFTMSVSAVAGCACVQRASPGGSCYP